MPTVVEMHWIDLWTRFCGCGGVMQRCYTDGVKRYVTCPICLKTWNVDTYLEIVDGVEIAGSHPHGDLPF